MKRKFLFLILLIGTSIIGFSQTKFRSGVFLHHSTGDNIWGPNGSATSIPQEMVKYNTNHGYTGVNAVQMESLWWPNADNNEWEYWHRIFENKDVAISDIRPLLAANKIVVIKSCFPTSNMSGLGQSSDTTSPGIKSIYNYKWHWRHIIKVMKQHPGNFFAIWTNAPQVLGSTDAGEAALSKSFCIWAKDTLAKGLDTVVGTLPSNIFLFNFFSKLTDSNGYMQNQYATSPSDSHPNAAATSLVAPQFVSEIFDAAILYESLPTSIQRVYAEKVLIFPNPAKDIVRIMEIPTDGNSNLSVYNFYGERLINLTIDATSSVNISSLKPGIYVLKLTKNNKTEVRKLMVE